MKHFRIEPTIGILIYLFTLMLCSMIFVNLQQDTQPFINKNIQRLADSSVLQNDPTLFSLKPFEIC